MAFAKSLDKVISASAGIAGDADVFIANSTIEHFVDSSIASAGDKPELLVFMPVAALAYKLGGIIHTLCNIDFTVAFLRKLRYSRSNYRFTPPLARFWIYNKIILHFIFFLY